MMRFCSPPLLEGLDAEPAGQGAAAVVDAKRPRARMEGHPAEVSGRHPLRLQSQVAAFTFPGAALFVGGGLGGAGDGGRWWLPLGGNE